MSDARALARKEVEDPELQALPGPPKRQRTLAAVLMLLTMVASCAMGWSLRSEVQYAVSSSFPIAIGELASLEPSSLTPNQYVVARGLLGTAGAVRYARPFEGDSFRLQPVAGTARVWVEIRVPEGMEGPRFVPPSEFTGRLVPLSKAGLRLSGVTRSVVQQTGQTIAPDAWVLVDGASPRASRWAIALVVLFAFFAVWNGVSIIRILRPIR
ncbi:MAG TPA: hypothetical protein PKL73_03615 [Polyangiaceae bacterium]|nr:hypothetical protein [Polyangiaceae bacterium]HNZ22333.1 hypothetical protein [Polyangiaceae bacterium]